MRSAPAKLATQQDDEQSERVNVADLKRAADQIEPTFRVPAVRIEWGFMEPTEVNANRFASVAGGRISLDDLP